MTRRRRPPRPGSLADLAPLRILTQIFVLQIAYYLSATILIVFTALAAGKALTIDLLLDWHTIRGDVTDGWTLALVWMLNSLVAVFYILLLIARSKLVLDFAVTIHFIHLVATSLYTHEIPKYPFWWGVQVASSALMTFLGIWTCQWRELRPINFGKASAASVETSRTDVQDDGVGYPQGRGAGAGRDGAGTYEMVSMKG